MRGRPPVYKYVPGVQLREGYLYKYTYRGLNYLLKSKVNGNPDYFNLDFFELQNPQTLIYQNESTALTAAPLVLGQSKVKFREGGEVRNSNDSAVPFYIVNEPAFNGALDVITSYVYGEEDKSYKMNLYSGVIFPGYKVENRYSPTIELYLGKIALGVTITIDLEKMDSVVNSDYLFVIVYRSNTVNLVTTPLDSTATSCRYQLPTSLGATKALTLFNNLGTIDIEYV